MPKPMFNNKQSSQTMSPIRKVSSTNKLEKFFTRTHSAHSLDLLRQAIERTESNPEINILLDRPDICVTKIEYPSPTIAPHPLTTEQRIESMDDTEQRVEPSDTETTESADSEDSISESDTTSSSDHELEYGNCCFCGEPCNILSQACSYCMRRGYFLSSYNQY